MEKIKCYNCDYFAEPAHLKEKAQAYCRYLDKRIARDTEKARCKYFCQTDLCHRCKNFRLRCGLPSHACVIGTSIKLCPQYNHPERCEQYEDEYGL